MFGDFRKEFWISTAIIVVGFTAFSATTFWAADAIRSTVKHIVEERAQIRGRARLVDALAELKSVIPQIASYEEGMKKILPRKDGLLDFKSKFLEPTAKQHNVTYVFSFESEAVPASTKEAGSVRFTLSATGQYENLKSFFTALGDKRSSFVIDLGSLDITKGPNDYRAVVQGKVFFQ